MNGMCEENARQPEPVRGSVAFHLAFAIEGELFAEKQILGAQGSPGPGAGPRNTRKSIATAFVTRPT